MSLRVDIGVGRGDFRLEVALEAAAGETVALLGPNGAGKSTLVSILAGLLRPDRGRVDLDGRTIEDADAGTSMVAAARPVGVMFQDLLLLPHLSALENVAFPLRARGVPRATARERARSLLERLGVAPRASARPGELSGGEAQRVALARALIVEPRLLLLDEPLSALDVRSRGQIRTLVQRTLAGFDGVRLLVTHDPVEAMTLADRMVLIEDGRVTQAGTPEEIRLGPRTPYAAELVGVNLFAGRLVPMGEGVGRLETEDGEITVGWPPVADSPMEGVLGLLKPADVSLFTSRPEGSARNVLGGPVESITLEGDRARVRLATSPPLVAEITLGSVSRLGLSRGSEVWASFKAVEVSVILP
jgi:molybdate transport system ATP-binding protein